MGWDNYFSKNHLPLNVIIHNNNSKNHQNHLISLWLWWNSQRINRQMVNRFMIYYCNIIKKNMIFESITITLCIYYYVHLYKIEQNVELMPNSIILKNNKYKMWKIHSRSQVKSRVYGKLMKSDFNYLTVFCSFHFFLFNFQCILTCQCESLRLVSWGCHNFIYYKLQL